MSDKAISGTDSLKNDRLLPCPFCGGEAEIHPSSDWDAHLTGATYFAWCDKCETRGNYYSTEREAAEAWNMRAGSVCAFAEPTDLTDGCSLLKERTCENVMPRSYNYLECSLCGSLAYKGSAEFRYCPNCGAKVVDG